MDCTRFVSSCYEMLSYLHLLVPRYFWREVGDTHTNSCPSCLHVAPSYTKDIAVYCSGHICSLHTSLQQDYGMFNQVNRDLGIFLLVFFRDSRGQSPAWMLFGEPALTELNRTAVPFSDSSTNLILYLTWPVWDKDCDLNCYHIKSTTSGILADSLCIYMWLSLLKLCMLYLLLGCYKGPDILQM